MDQNNQPVLPDASNILATLNNYIQNNPDLIAGLLARNPRLVLNIRSVLPEEDGTDIPSSSYTIDPFEIPRNLDVVRETGPSWLGSSVTHLEMSILENSLLSDLSGVSAQVEKADASPDVRRLDDQDPGDSSPIRSGDSTNSFQALADLAKTHYNHYSTRHELNDLNNAIEIASEALRVAASSDLKVVSISRDLLFWLRVRHEKTGDLTDLEEMSKVGRQVIAAVPNEHPLLPELLDSTSDVFMYKFLSTQASDDLSQAIDFETRAVDLTPQDSARFPVFLNNLAALLGVRYRLMKNPHDLGQSIQLSKQAISKISENSPFLGAVWCTLGTQLGDEYQRTSRVDILKEALSALEKAVAVTPKDDKAYSSRIYELAMQLKTKFSHTGVRADLEEAVSVARQALAAMSEKDPNAAVILGGLGGLLMSRFQTSEIISRKGADLEEAIELTNKAIAATPAQHVDLPPRLHNLSLQLGKMHVVTGEIFELEEAIGLEKRAIALTPASSQNLIAMYQNLHSLLGDQYGFTGELAHLSECIQYAEKAVAATSGNRPALIVSLTNLSVFCHDRFVKSGSFDDLARAISAAKRVIAVTGHEGDLSLALHNLSTFLLALYETDPSLANLDEYVDVLRRTVATTPKDHHDLPVRQRDLAVGLRMKYEETNDSLYMDEAFGILQEAVSSTAEDHPDILLVRGELTDHLQHQCRLSCDLTLIDEVVQTIRESVAIAGKYDSSEEKMIALVQLGEVLRRRHYFTSNLSDLEEAVQASRQAVAIATQLGRKLVLALLSLADRLGQWYLAIGRPSDLDEAIRVARRAITLTVTPQDDPNNSALLILATLLVQRYRRNNFQEDIEEAIHILRQAFEVKPHAQYSNMHANRKPVLLGLLADTLGDRYSRTHVSSDQDEAISAARQAIAISRDHDQHRPMLLHCLGRQLLNRHSHSNSDDSKDLDESIQVFRQLMSFIPSKGPDIIPAAHGLATSLNEKYLITDSLTMLEEAIELIRSAVKLVPVTDPVRVVLLTALADYLRDRYEVKGMSSDLIEAYESYTASLYQEGANTMLRIYAAKQIIAASTDWRVIRDVSGWAMSLLPRLSLRSMNNMDKQFTLGEVMGIASDAAAAVLNLGPSSLSLLSSGVAALKLLEQGRGLLGTSLEEIRADTTELRASHPRLEERFVQLRQQLELPASQSLLPGTSEGYSLGQGGRRHDAGKEFDELITDIRNLSGFERFLLSPTEAEMLDAASSGPIVVINVSRFRCDALLVQHDGLHAVPLPKLSKEETERRAQRGDLASTETLEWLWDAICSPVMETLGLTTSPQDGKWTRIWWVPTGPLTHFPLHAAGYHRRLTSETVLDRVISTYSSSIKTIINVRRRRPVQSKENNKRAVVVAMEHTPKHASLQFARPELTEVRRVLETRGIEVVEPVMKKAAVIQQLQGCHVFHFAGHGRSDAADASQGGLLLEDGILKVADVYEISLQRQSPHLAYLSACETGRIKDSQYADESIHLISAFQLAGFRHVIGTLWQVEDELCVEMARIVYQEIVQGAITDESVAYGLHQACRQLRDQWRLELANKTRTRSAGDMPPIPPQRQEPGGNNSTEGLETPILERDITIADDEEGVESILWAPYVHFGV